MGLKFEIETLEGVDESVKGLYTEHDGKFRLAVEGLDDSAALKKEIEALRAKSETLMNETKAAKRARQEAEEVARKEAEERAKKAGDFEQLHKSSEQARAQLQEQYANLSKSIAEEKEGAEALRIAAALADGSNADLLSSFVRGRIRHTDEGIKVLDKAGSLSIMTVDDLKKEFMTDPRYAALIRGSRATGGGASGSSSSGGADKLMSRSDFEAKSPAERMKFTKSGGKVAD